MATERLTNEKIIRGWFNKQLGKPGGFWSHDQYTYTVWVTSYGELRSDFLDNELAVVTRDGRGTRTILINGGRGGLGIAQQQALARKMAIASGKPWVTIPFRSLDEGRIVKASIRLIDKTEDEFWDETETQFELPVGAQEVQPKRLVAGTGGYVNKQGRFSVQALDNYGWEWVAPQYEDNPDVEPVLVQPRGWVKWTRTTIGDITSYSRTVHHHRLGSAVFAAKVTMGYGKKDRQATFLSGFDHNEAPPAYFLAELPPDAKVKTVAEAYEALKPEVVKDAESMGREVRRQGDIFAVKMSDDTNAKFDDWLRSGTHHAFARANEYLLKTNHRASRVMELDGQTYASGTLTHRPQWRQPDHRPVTLDNGWWLIKKNTVPVTHKPRNR